MPDKDALMRIYGPKREKERVTIAGYVRVFIICANIVRLIKSAGLVKVEQLASM
jgi:hypothetical protein